jgi:hypothetical protein
VALSIFRSRTLAAGDVVTLLTGAWTGGEVLILSLYCQQVLGYTPLQTGLVVVPQGGGGSHTGRRRRLARDAARRQALPHRKHGALRVRPGPALALPGDQPLPAGGRRVVHRGFATTSTVFGAVVVGTAGVTDDEQGLASALVNASRQVGSAVGVAALLSIAAAQTAGGSTTASAAGYRLARASQPGSRSSPRSSLLSSFTIEPRDGTTNGSTDGISTNRGRSRNGSGPPARGRSAVPVRGLEPGPRAANTRSRDVAEARFPALSCRASVRQRF